MYYDDRRRFFFASSAANSTTTKPAEQKKDIQNKQHLAHQKEEYNNTIRYNNLNSFT